MDSRGRGRLMVAMAERLIFGRWGITDPAVQAEVMPPVHPLRGRQLKVL